MAWNRYAGNKYGNRKVKVGEKVYHSAMEAQDAMSLQDMEKRGEITELKEQVRYRIFHEGEHAFDSIVDFQFKHNGKTVWYETKGFPTKEYLMKKKLIEIEMKTRPDERYIVNFKDLQDYLRGRVPHT